VGAGGDLRVGHAFSCGTSSGSNHEDDGCRGTTSLALVPLVELVETKAASSRL